MKQLTHISLALLMVQPALYAQSASEKTHQDYALALLDLLAETELCLAQCVDLESIQHNKPRLQELSEQMQELSVLLQNLPEPTIADYIAAEQQVSEFNTLWNAIKKHVQRLREAGFYSDELLAIIKLVN